VGSHRFPLPRGGVSHEWFFEIVRPSVCPDAILWTFGEPVAGCDHVIYVACRNQENEQISAVVLCVWVNYDGVRVRRVSETERPSAWHCPSDILSQLTPTTNETANEWRVLCRAAQA
jgi:hypothetical protein